MKTNTRESTTKHNLSEKLTPRERAFMTKLLACNNQKTAYLFVSPGVVDSTAKSQGSKMVKRIKSKVDWARLLEEYGFDDFTLLYGLKGMLNARTTKFWRDKKIATVVDNATRMRAIELLANLRGKLKLHLELSDEPGRKMYFVLSPDVWPDKDDKDSAL